MKITFVRHARSTYNDERRLTGQHNPPLSPEGVNQAKDAAHKYCVEQYEYFWASDLRRSMQTLAHICSQQDARQFKFNRLLREQCCGDFEGMLIDDVKKSLGGDWNTDDEQWETPFPNGESLKDVACRLKQWFEHIPDGNHLVVSHGETIKAASVLFGVEMSERHMKNCDCLVIENPQIAVQL